MIVSHKHKFIFIKTRKTAGTSIEIGLSQLCGENDIITPISPVDEAKRQELGFLGAQNFKVPRSKWSKKEYLERVLKKQELHFYNHMEAQEVKNLLEPEVWNSYFKFCIDRNPYDKAMSHYFWRKADKKYNTVGEYLKNGGLSKKEHGINSYDTYSIDNIKAVDKIYKFEDLAFFEKDITDRLSLTEPFKLPQYKAKSNHRKAGHYRDFLTPECVDIIKVAFAREIALLDYKY